MAAQDHSANVIAFAGNTMVYESVRRFSVKGLNRLLGRLMENIDDALFELAKKVDNDRDRNMYFDAMRDIRRKRKEFEDVFDDEIKESFNRLMLNRTLKTDDFGAGELSLVAQEEIEDRLAIENMIARARPHFEDDLFAVGERLKVVLHRKTIEKDLNPLDPKSICESFHKAAELFDIEIQAKLIFYKLFEQYVMAGMSEFYRELNKFFIEKGVLPDFKAAEERFRQHARIKSASASFDTGAAGSASAASVSAPNAGPGGTGTGEANILAMLQSIVGGQGAPASAGSPGASQGGYAGGGGLSSGQGTSAAPASAGNGNAVASGSASYVTALTGLQSAPIFAQPVQSVDPASMKAELQQQLVSFRQDNASAGSAADNQIIDIVSMLFDFFFDDETLPDPIKVLIGRLQIPILKVAILDQHFFNSRKHPARRLLDSISKAALGWSEQLSDQQLLIDKLETIVDRLLAEFEDDVSVFEAALGEFSQFIVEENRRVEQNLQELERAEQERETRVEASQQMSQRILDKLESKYSFSPEVINFLRGIWRSVLFNTHLGQGSDSRHWRNLKKISSTLIWTLIPKDTEEEKAKLLKTLPPLLRALSKAMELVQIEREQQNLVFQMLVIEHSKIVKQTAKNIVTRVDDMTVWPEQHLQDALEGFSRNDDGETHIDFLLAEDETGEIRIVDTSELEAGEEDQDPDPLIEVSRSETQDVIRNLQEFTDCIVNGEIHIDEEIVMDSADNVEFHKQPSEQDDECLKQAEALEIGDWVEFQEEGAGPVNAKLSWKSNVTGKYVFVNRHGHKIRNMTIYGFATELRAQRAKLIKNVSAFDRAINSLMSSVRHQ